MGRSGLVGLLARDRFAMTAHSSNTEGQGLYGVSLDRNWFNPGYEGREWGDDRSLWDKLGLGELLGLDRHPDHEQDR